MSARKTAHQVWHVSRGIVFSGGSTVVYPRLPTVRHHSAPAAAVSEGSPDCLPVILSTASAPEGLPAGQGPSSAAHAEVVATLLTTTAMNTSISATSTTVVIAENEAKENQTPAKDATEEAKPKDTTPVLPPYTPLEFKISDKAFQEAREAADGTPESYWNYSLYRGPGEDGNLSAKVKVHYCTSSRTTERVIQQYFMNEKILGFDLEWNANATKNSGPRNNVSLIQLASPSRIGLFHVAAFPQNDVLVAPSLKKLLEDPEITKVGVWIKGDCKRMSHYLDVHPRGQFELSHLYRLVKYSKSGEHALINKKLVALATQVKECLGLPMFKGNDVRASDWSKPLSMEQILYSSSDAYAAVQLYAILDHDRKNLDDVPPLPHHAELNLPLPITLQTVKKVQEMEAEEPAGEPAAENAVGDLDECAGDRVERTAVILADNYVANHAADKVEDHATEKDSAKD